MAGQSKPASLCLEVMENRKEDWKTVGSLFQNCEFHSKELVTITEPENGLSWKRPLNSP